MKRHDMITFAFSIICIIILVPLGIAFLLSFNFINTDTTNEWIGFWGGYLGGIIGGAITLYVLYKTLEDGKKTRKIEERIMYCDKLAECIAEYDCQLSKFSVKVFKYYGLIKEYGRADYIEEVLDVTYAIEKSVFILTVQLSSKKDNHEYKNITVLQNIVDGIKDAVESIMLPLLNDDLKDMEEKVFEDMRMDVELRKKKLLDETVILLTDNKKF